MMYIIMYSLQPFDFVCLSVGLPMYPYDNLPVCLSDFLYYAECWNYQAEQQGC